MLLDSAGLYFRTFYGVPDTVRGPNGETINAVHGLRDMISRLVTEFEPTEIVACWHNDWCSQWRVDLIPTYTTRRVVAEQPSSTMAADADPTLEVVPDFLSPQITIIRDVLGTLAPTVHSTAHSASPCASHSGSDIAVNVVTGDRDLFQPVDDSRGVRVIYAGRGMSRLEILTDTALTATTGFTPARYADFACLRGDAPTDCLVSPASASARRPRRRSWPPLRTSMASPVPPPTRPVRLRRPHSLGNARPDGRARTTGTRVGSRLVDDPPPHGAGRPRAVYAPVNRLLSAGSGASRRRVLRRPRP
jgi:hypothetical protein